MLSTKKSWLFGLKLLVTVALVTYLLSNASWATVLEQAKQLPLLVVLATFAVLFLSVTISAYKWQLFLNIHGLNFRFNQLHRYYFIAMYINNFLPTSIGGDGYRVYKTLDNQRSKSSALIAVIMERITGLSALLILALTSAGVLFVKDEDTIALFALVVGVLGGAALVLAYLLFPSRYLHSLKEKFPKVTTVVNTVTSHLMDYLGDRRSTVKVVAVSFLFNFHLSLAYVLLLNVGLGLSISIFEIFVVLAGVGIIGVLPISINGIGVIEGAFVFLIGHYGVDYDDALLVAVLLRLLVIPISIIGAVLYILGDTRMTDAVDIN